MAGRSRFMFGWLGLAAGLAAMISGCGTHTQSASQARQVPGLTQLGLFYSFYCRQHQGKPPADEAAFRAFIKSQPAEQLQRFKIENVDSMFVSPRDGKPYVVAYGGRPGSPKPLTGAVPVAWEQNGKRGRRFIVNSMGKLEEVDEGIFRRMLSETPTK